MEMKHTPGPWAYIKPDGYIVRHPRIYSDTDPVCNATWLGDGRIDELIANARLIAAAPDLLDALQSIADCCNEDHTARDYVSRQAEIRGIARAAIAKATGSES